MTAVTTVADDLLPSGSRRPGRAQAGRGRSTMNVTAIVLVTAAVFVWGVVSARLERADLTLPSSSSPWGRRWRPSALVDASSAPETLRPLARSLSSGCSSPTPHGCRRRSSSRSGTVRAAAGHCPAPDDRVRLGTGCLALPRVQSLAGPLRWSRHGSHRCGARRPRRDQHGGALASPPTPHRRERPQRRNRHAHRHGRNRGGGSHRGTRGGRGCWQRGRRAGDRCGDRRGGRRCGGGC